MVCEPENPFDLLGLPRRPWLAAEAINAAFRERARELHPDGPRGDASRFADLNAACAIVSNPARRLRCLLGAAAGPGPVSDADLFLRIGSVLQRGRDLASRLSRSPSRLARSLVAGAVREQLADLGAAKRELTDRQADADRDLRALDARWPDVDPAAAAQLAARIERLDHWERELAEQALRLES